MNATSPGQSVGDAMTDICTPVQEGAELTREQNICRGGSFHFFEVCELGWFQSIEGEPDR